MSEPHPQTQSLYARLINEARLIPSDAHYLKAFAESLRRHGLPVRWLTIGIPTLHPQIDSVSGLWRIRVKPLF